LRRGKSGAKTMVVGTRKGGPQQNCEPSSRTGKKKNKLKQLLRRGPRVSGQLETSREKPDLDSASHHRLWPSLAQRGVHEPVFWDRRGGERDNMVSERERGRVAELKWVAGENLQLRNARRSGGKCTDVEKSVENPRPGGGNREGK